VYGQTNVFKSSAKVQKIFRDLQIFMRKVEIFFGFVGLMGGVVNDE